MRRSTPKNSTFAVNDVLTRSSHRRGDFDGVVSKLKEEVRLSAVGSLALSTYSNPPPSSSLSPSSPRMNPQRRRPSRR